MVTLFPTHSTNASGALSCWYSDDCRIGRWNSNYLDVYKWRLSLNNSPYFLDGISHACSQWGNALSLNISSSITCSDAPIRYYGGSLAAINTFWDYQITNEVNGVTDLHDYYYTDTWYLGTSVYTGLTIYGVEGCIIDKGYTPNKTKKTCTHELGHALGWIGHSDVSSDIMYKRGSSITSLSYRDIQHLSQVY